jgi:hypothetical protein
MRLRHLTLQNFRNIPLTQLALTGRLQFFVGANGQGKTNLLEAVGCLTALRSDRGGGRAGGFRLRARFCQGVAGGNPGQRVGGLLRHRRRVCSGRSGRVNQARWGQRAPPMQNSADALGEWYEWTIEITGGRPVPRGMGPRPCLWICSRSKPDLRPIRRQADTPPCHVQPTALSSASSIHH